MPQVPVLELAIFTRQLAVMHQAGLSIAQALQALARSGSSQMCLLATEIHRDLSRGHSLSESLQVHPEAFSPIYVGVIEAAESSGDLRPLLHQLADLLERQAQVRQRVVSAMAYPAVLITVSILAVVGLTCLVLPMFAPMFADLHVQLPLITRVLLGFAAFVRHPLTLLLMGGGGVALYLRRDELVHYFQDNPDRKRALDELLLRLPVVGNTLEKIVAIRLLYTLATLLEAGMFLGPALERAQGVLGNQILRERFGSARVDILQGTLMSTAFDRYRVVPRAAVFMIRAGEEANEMVPLMRRAAYVHEEQINLRIGNVAAIIEPIVLSVMGLVVGAVVLAAMLPTVRIIQSL